MEERRATANPLGEWSGRTSPTALEVAFAWGLEHFTEWLQTENRDVWDDRLMIRDVGAIGYHPYIPPSQGG